MAKKKIAAKLKPATRAAAPKKVVRKTPVKAKRPSPAQPTSKSTSKVRTSAKARPVSKPASLGRPLVTAEEKLYLLFKDDYHARQIFEFLRVETVGELEAFAADQIVRLLSKPIRETVDRIRNKLAEKHRHLLDDLEFALARQAAAPTPPPTAS